MKKVLAILTLVTLLGLSAIASDLVIESKTQTFSEKDNKIKFEGDVKVSIDEVKVIGQKADVTVGKNQKLDVATFYDKPYAYEVKKNKKREVKANILKVSLINKIVTAEGDTQSTVFDGKEPVVIITADSQEYNTQNNVMKARGQVIIHYKDLETFSDSAIIKTNKEGDLQRIDLIGSARLKQDKHLALADHFIYNPATQELISIGHATTNAILDDGSKLVLKADYQEYDQKSNTFLGSGHVKIWFKDYYAQGPKVTFYPDKKTGKPNEIYFTGRSSVTQDVKTVYADKIKLILRPKNFFAEGNTKTVIKDVGSLNDNKSF
ncbi:MAG TPA: LptA/OstA family protein [Candidatus Gastranaerophilaceae bacterium]|nr:LptA/OstA family protein [Candidatus Gastranaerophilaceae bacterium]HPT42050.1 LptA/OstA family protein [Candidatus Gastranaerophilaceae bacterium]